MADTHHTSGSRAKVIRADVVTLLADMRPGSPFSHRDGRSFTVNEVELALTATDEERIAGAEAGLIASVPGAVGPSDVTRIRRRGWANLVAEASGLPIAEVNALISGRDTTPSGSKENQ